jgi:DNA-binding MarR family transcriptional regulator
LPHPDDRRKLLIDITPAAQAILDELLPSFHARERLVINAALTPAEQRSFLKAVVKLQQSALDARSAPPPSGATRRRGTNPKQ